MEFTYPKGFQGSETTRAEVFVYTHGGAASAPDARVGSLGNGTFKFQGEGSPSLVAVQVNKAMGAPSGTFTFDLKVPGGSKIDFREIFMDDDWVDIVFRKHAKSFHVMRGLIDDVRRFTTVSPSGATITVFRISGRDFGKIFEQTPFWFDRVTQGNNWAAAVSRIWAEHGDIALGRVDGVVRNFLSAFLLRNINQAAGIWRMPPSIPGRKGDDFLSNLVIYNGDFTNTPARSAPIRPTMFSPDSQNVWALAKDWSDPILCELFVDIVATDTDLLSRNSVYLQEGEETQPGQTQMAVVIRDRPFPNSERDEKLGDAPFFRRLPAYTISRQNILQQDIGRSGTERCNTFFYAPLLAETSGFLNLQIPLCDPDDISLHGMRRFDVVSKYISAGTEEGYALMSARYRRIVRDLHCMNHLFYNGGITLNISRPDIRVGGRLLISAVDPLLQESYYIESVNHQWAFETGARTAMTVSRGWIGTDETFLSAFEYTTSKYQEIEPVTKSVNETQEFTQTSFPIVAPDVTNPTFATAAPTAGEQTAPTSELIRLVPGYLVDFDANGNPVLVPAADTQRNRTGTIVERPLGQ